jgi:hypothetical protein
MMIMPMETTRGIDKPATQGVGMSGRAKCTRQVYEEEMQDAQSARGSNYEGLIFIESWNRCWEVRPGSVDYKSPCWKPS